MGYRSYKYMYDVLFLKTLNTLFNRKGKTVAFNKLNRK